jgi:hypothetical protein
MPRVVYELTDLQAQANARQPSVAYVPARTVGEGKKAPIHYTHSNIAILDRAGLKAFSCGRYCSAIDTYQRTLG